MRKPRIILVGAVWSTEVALKALAAAGHPPVLLLTLPLEKAHWHSDYVDLGPVAELLGVSTMRVEDVNRRDILAALAELGPDIIMVVGWSRLCGTDFLKIPRIGTLGYHPTLLPKMRGRAALAWTILLDVRKTGGTLFWVDEGVDSGPIAIQRSFQLTGEERLSDLIDLHKETLAGMLPSVVDQIARGERPAAAQDHAKATYLAVRRPADGEIDWCREAADIERLVRSASRPYPGAFTYLRDRKLVIWSARVVHYPNWHAQQGQIFTYENELPIVRCGSATDLALVEFELCESEGVSQSGASPIRGQPRLGLRP